MKMRTRFVTTYLLTGGLAVYLNLHADIAVPTAKPLAEFPQAVSSWTMSSQWELSAGVQDVLKASDYLSRQYTDQQGNKVTLYIGYHSGGKDAGAIHSPKHCLPGSGWFEVSSSAGTLPIGSQPLKLVRSVYQKGDQKELYLYWFQVKGKSLSDEYRLKFAEISNSLLYKRRDSAFIRVSVPFETDQAAAVARGEQFIRDMYPVIQSYLPQ